MNLWLWIAFGLIVFVAACQFAQIPYMRYLRNKIAALEMKIDQKGKHRKC